MCRIKNIYAPLIFVCLLLIPIAEKVMHDWVHGKEIHCLEKQILHFHTTEHNCSLCNFQQTAILQPSVPACNSELYSSQFLFVEKGFASAFFSEIEQSLSRGPPFF